MLLGKVSFILALIALGIFTYFQFFQKTIDKQTLDVTEFLSRDPDVVTALRLLNNGNSYRTDINENVGHLVHTFASIYIQLLFEWDVRKYENLLRYEQEIMESISSLEYERDNIPYENAFIAMELVITKYKTILANKYSLDVNAPNPRDNKCRHNMI
jgi:hypothetical protein